MVIRKCLKIWREYTIGEHGRISLPTTRTTRTSNCCTLREFSGHYPELPTDDLICPSLVPNGKYHTVFPDISVQIVPINHGTTDVGPYSSSAFFIRSDSHPSKREFLFFGDVEPDSITSATPKIIDVWRKAAPMIPNTLSTIFIECSWPSGRPDDMLHGHLSPEHLRDELVVLATEIYHSRRSSSGGGSRPKRKRQKRNPSVSADELRGLLTGVRIYIIHCKEQSTQVEGPPTRELIVGQVRALVQTAGLGAEILSAEQGMYISERLILYLCVYHSLSNFRSFLSIKLIKILTRPT